MERGAPEDAFDIGSVDLTPGTVCSARHNSPDSRGQPLSHGRSVTILRNVDRPLPLSRPTVQLRIVQPAGGLASRLVSALIVILIVAAISFLAWLLISPTSFEERFPEVSSDQAYTVHGEFVY